MEKVKKNSKKTTDQNFLEFVQDIYGQSTGREISRLEKTKAEAVKEESDQFSMTTILGSPYLQKYTLNDVSQAYEGQQNGYRLGLEQNTPYGLSLQLGYDKKLENNLSTNLNDKSGWSLGLSVRLLENFIGFSDRFTTASLFAEAKAIEIQAEINLRQNCEEIIQNVSNIWSHQEKNYFLDGLQNDNKILNQFLSESHRNGQLSKVEYLGAQSELLQIENQKIQNDRVLVGALDQLFIETKEKNISRISGSDPSIYFEKLWEEYKKKESSEVLSTQLLQQKIISLEAKTESLKNKNLPELDFIISKSSREGDLMGEIYKEDNQKAELKFSWKLNDQIEKSLLKQAEVLKIQAQLNQDRNQRQQKANYQNTLQDLSSQLTAVENLTRRLKYLLDIKNEYQRRYRQGRISFQEYLRQKELWSQASFQLIESKVTFWNHLTKAYHQFIEFENICEKRGSL